MINNIIFDIGNVILNFKLHEVLSEFTLKIEEQQFIIDNIINSPEWLGNSLIDTGYITKEEAISIVQDRTNHINDELISNFWNNYNKYLKVDFKVIDLIKLLKDKGYKIYLLSNINEHTYNNVKESGIFDMVDGYVLSYLEHQVKPYNSIYNTLLNRYNLKANECLFIDDNQNNVDTAIRLGFNALKVEPDNYNDLHSKISKYIEKNFE